jgi:uncharacterized protein involved in exopolysaccharide biosynthesis
MDNAARPQNSADKATVGASVNATGSSVPRGLDDGTINLADYFRVISKYRRMIFWICTITVITTAIISLFVPKSFSATTSVVPPVDVLQKEAGIMAGGLGAVKSSMLRQAIDVTSISNMYVGILKSRSIADAIIEKADLASVYKVGNSITAVRKTLRNRTSIKVTNEGIVTITVEDRNPYRAAELANAYVEELDRQNKRLFVSQAASKKIFLENRLKEIELDLSRIDNLLSRDAKIKEMLFELLTREYEIAKIEEAKSMPTIQVLDEAIVPEARIPRGTIKNTVLAWVVSLTLAIFAAFAREYFTKVRDETERTRATCV